MTKVNIAVLRPGTLSQPATAAFAKKRRLQMPRILVKSRGVFQGKSRNTTRKVISGGKTQVKYRHVSLEKCAA